MFPRPLETRTPAKRSCRWPPALALVLVVMLAATLMVGCGGGGDASPAPQADAPAPAAAGAADAPAATSAAAESAAAPPASVAPAGATAAESLTPAAPGGDGVAAAGEDEAAVWVTENRGAELVLAAVAPAGLTALQALDRVADVEARYGGRFVQEVEGRAGSLEQRRDWFFTVNGIEPDVGAAEVRVHAGDVIWFDLRGWNDPAGHPAARVGAFPAPFSTGWNGERRPVEVRAPAELADARDALAALLERGGEGEPHVFELAVEAGSEGAELRAAMGERNGSPVTFRLSGALEAVRAAALALADDPTLVARRYEARFDAAGALIDDHEPPAAAGGGEEAG